MFDIVEEGRVVKILYDMQISFRARVEYDRKQTLQKNFCIIGDKNGAMKVTLAGVRCVFGEEKWGIH